MSLSRLGLSPYASATIWIGCFGVFPVPWRIWIPASGQSVATRSGRSASTTSKTGRPTFIERGKYSVFMLQVPSCPVHFSTVTTSLPGMSWRRSRDLKPMSWTFRWQGTW